ncbi:hypothetical protein BDM02DRAFT_3187360 [Thelephora ganbajun]|uniref:Uncharacterized protein n=1 Tax=Thelephora ganbajun TaxID=370292 RepID=A0ACB6ZF17_THEGA|nr:hypothetical protein BDM02DRAFT_3187360 [Thelephora ganbajun]
MSFSPRPPSPEEGSTPLDVSNLTQMAPVRQNTPNLFAGLSMIRESVRDSTRSPTIAGRMEHRRSANKLSVRSTSRNQLRNVSRASSPATPSRRRSVTSGIQVDNTEFLRRANAQLDEARMAVEEISDDELNYGEGTTPRESYDRMVKRIQGQKSPIQAWAEDNNYGTDTLTQRITAMEALEDSELKTHRIIQDPEFAGTCQATLAQSLTGTNEVCKASHKDTRLVCLLVSILQRVSVSSSSNVELAEYKLWSDSV